MSYNKHIFKEIDLGNFTKSNPYKKDIIVDPRGQWAHPGKNTRIPGSDITMDNVPYPVWAQPNVGPGMMMQPGQDYNFPGADYVDEFPQMQSGGHTVKQRRGVRENSDGSVSSHLMKAEYVDGRGWVAFPSLFQDSKPYADDQENWNEVSEEDGWWPIYQEAERRGEVYDFGEDKEAALAFGMGSWKDQLPEHLQDKQTGGVFNQAAYSDSLNLYKAYKMQDKLMGPGSTPYKRDDLDWSTEALRDARIPRMVPGSPTPVARDFQSEEEQFKNGFNPWWAREEDQELIDYYRSLGFGDDQIMFHSSPDIASDTIKPIGTYNDGTAASPIYKKPVMTKAMWEAAQTPFLLPRKLEEVPTEEKELALYTHEKSKSKSKDLGDLVSSLTSDGRVVINNLTTGGSMGLYDTPEQAQVAMLEFYTDGYNVMDIPGSAMRETGDSTNKLYDVAESQSPWMKNQQQMINQQAINKIKQSQQQNNNAQSNYEKLKKLKRYTFAEGGENRFLPKAQRGGRKPIELTDPNDPRLEGYKDSLDLYNFSNDFKNRVGDLIGFDSVNSSEDLFQANKSMNQPPQLYNAASAAFYPHPDNPNIRVFGNWDKNKKPTKDLLGEAVHAEFIHPTIGPTGAYTPHQTWTKWFTGSGPNYSGYNLTYPKPVQPYIYKEEEELLPGHTVARTIRMPGGRALTNISPKKSYKAAYKNVDKEKYPTIDAFIADAEYYKKNGKNMPAEDLAKINNVTDYIENNDAEENQIKSVELEEDSTVEPDDKVFVMEDKDYNYYSIVGIKLTKELLSKYNADHNGIYKVPKTSKPIKKDSTPGVTLKLPATSDEWKWHPQIKTWYQTDKPTTFDYDYIYKNSKDSKDNLQEGGENSDTPEEYNAWVYSKAGNQVVRNSALEKEWRDYGDGKSTIMNPNWKKMRDLGYAPLNQAYIDAQTIGIPKDERLWNYQTYAPNMEGVMGNLSVYKGNSDEERASTMELDNPTFLQIVDRNYWYKRDKYGDGDRWTSAPEGKEYSTVNKDVPDLAQMRTLKATKLPTEEPNRDLAKFVSPVGTRRRWSTKENKFVSSIINKDSPSYKATQEREEWARQNKYQEGGGQNKFSGQIDEEVELTDEEVEALEKQGYTFEKI